jgi:hypothetical protein
VLALNQHEQSVWNKLFKLSTMVFRGGSSLDKVNEIPAVTGDALDAAKAVIQSVHTHAYNIQELLWNNVNKGTSIARDLNQFQPLIQQEEKLPSCLSGGIALQFSAVHWWRLTNRITKLYFYFEEDLKKKHPWFKTSWGQVYARTADADEDGEGGEYVQLLLDQLVSAFEVWKNVFEQEEKAQDALLSLNHCEVISYEAIREFSLLCNASSTFTVDGDSLLATEESLLFWYRYLGPFKMGETLSELTKSLMTTFTLEQSLSIPASDVCEKLVRNAMGIISQSYWLVVIIVCFIRWRT